MSLVRVASITLVRNKFYTCYKRGARYVSFTLFVILQSLSMRFSTRREREEEGRKGGKKGRENTVYKSLLVIEELPFDMKMQTS